MKVQAVTRKPRTLPTQKDPRWKAVVARDPAANGTFYYSVKTTGVYCVPSCAARLAKPENVRFHRTREDAERAGFRPCKRCKPDARELHFAIGDSSLGLVLVARSVRGVSAVLLGDDRASLRLHLERSFPGATLVEGGATATTTTAEVIRFIEAPGRALQVPLDMRGTPFQRSVWQALRDIPPGSTASYAEIANRIGSPSSARAVGHACAANLLAVVVPCHRVLGRDGRLVGYRWGVQRKRALLDREATA